MVHDQMMLSYGGRYRLHITHCSIKSRALRRIGSWDPASKILQGFRFSIEAFSIVTSELFAKRSKFQH